MFVADSSNAAEVAQAAILMSQQKRLKHGGPTALRAAGLSQSSSNVLSAGPVIHHSATPTTTQPAVDYQQYREWPQFTGPNQHGGFRYGALGRAMNCIFGYGGPLALAEWNPAKFGLASRDCNPEFRDWWRPNPRIWGLQKLVKIIFFCVLTDRNKNLSLVMNKIFYVC